MTASSAFDAKVARKQARAATDPNGPTGRLATWLADTTLDDVPTSVLEHAKHLLLDGVACALVGAQLPVSRKGVEGVTPSTTPGAPCSSAGAAERPAPRRPRCSTPASSRGSNSTTTTRSPLSTATALVLPAMLAAAPHVGRVSGARFPARRDPRLRDGAAGWPSARRPGDDLPRLALGRGLRHPFRRRVRGNPSTGWTPPGSRTLSEWPPPSPAA